MKKIITICAAILMTANVFSQAPNKMSYQAVIRNNSNALVTNTYIGMRISILQTSSSGTAVYVETHTPTTNANGLASIEIGDGTLVSGSFADINWANGPYFIKTETDPSGGTSYTITGTSQLLSVPYALFSGNGIVGVSATGDTLYLGNGSHLIIPGISASNNSGGGGQTGITQHSCGATDVHNANLTYGSMNDQDGNIYKTIIIGTQEWMAENLKASHYLNGDLIPVVANNSTWGNLTTGATCWYSNDSVTYNCPYGKLYNWYAVVDSRNLCPTGWHVPTSDEYTTLENYLVSGITMQSTGSQYWDLSMQNANNESGFSGIPGGQRFGDEFYNLSSKALWWTSSVALGVLNGSTYCELNLNGDLIIGSNGFNRAVGHSVRCLKD